MRVYGGSKLANVLFTRELARRLEGRGVTANALHPGAVATRLGTNNLGSWYSGLPGLLSHFFLTPERGAATSLHLASSPDVEGVSGAYFTRSREVRPSAAARDEDLARELWKRSCEMVGIPGDPTP